MVNQCIECFKDHYRITTIKLEFKYNLDIFCNGLKVLKNIFTFLVGTIIFQRPYPNASRYIIRKQNNMCIFWSRFSTPGFEFSSPTSCPSIDFVVFRHLFPDMIQSSCIVNKRCINLGFIFSNLRSVIPPASFIGSMISTSQKSCFRTI